MSKSLKDKIRPFYFWCLEKFLYPISPCTLVKLRYKKRLGRALNLKNPQDLNEKINWLKLYSDTSQWSQLADKIKVREYVREKGLEDILVPIYGVWNVPSEIDWEQLPKSFVLKTNNGCGDYVLIKDKALTREKEIKSLLKKNLKHHFGVYDGEFHYKDIQPKILAETLLQQDELDFTDSLADYKVFCFSGKPYMILVIHNRTKDHVCLESYDLNWNYHPEWLQFNEHFLDGKGMTPKPKVLSQMLKYAEILSAAFPQVRVDFYVIGNRVYFGEMTFTSSAGYMEYFTPEFLLEMGKQVDLPQQ